MSKVGTIASRRSRAAHGGLHEPWDTREDIETESITALAGGTGKADSSVEARSAHDDSVPDGGIMRTQEVWQDSNSIKSHHEA